MWGIMETYDPSLFFRAFVPEESFAAGLLKNLALTFGCDNSIENA